MSRWPLLVAVLLTAPAWAREDTPPARPPFSVADAESLGRKLEAIKQRNVAKGQKGRETVTVSESELNSYLNLKYAAQMPAGISDVDVRFKVDLVQARGLLDLDRVRDKMPAQSPWSPIALLRGKVPVELSGRLETRDGFGTLQIEEASIASVPVPMAFLEEIVSYATKNATDPDGIDLNAPFRLPYAMNRVRFELTRAVLYF
jgi:hypothetical protein